MTGLTLQQEQGLMIARLLVKAGMPVFLAAADPTSPQGFRLPMGWQHVECDPATVDAWRPGDALCAVTGRAFDLVDIDPRSGGTEDAIPMPQSYLAAETPSGGRHHFVSALGVASRDGVAPGVDVKSGTLEGTGRGFAFIAPTVRASKVDGVAREYRWYTGPDGPGLPTADQRAADGSGARLRARVMELRRTQPQTAEPRRVPLSVARREFDRAARGLADDLRRWKVMGWGGEAHSGLLAATTHLARLDHAQAAAAFDWAFRAAGVEPDEADLTKLYSAIERAVPDVVVPDEQLTAQERFFLGGDSPLGAVPGLGEPAAAPASAYALGERRRFQPMTRDEADHIVPPDPLIAGVLLRGTKARLSGPSGAGKTWCALDLAAHVATGRDWQGRAVTRGRVLYVAAEGAPSFGLRMRAWDVKYGERAEVHLVPEAPQVMDSTWAELIFEMVEAGGYDLVIFDTQGAITVGSEENSNTDANIAQAKMSALILATGACVLLVHHTGWEDGDRPRGASAMYGGMDTELVLARTSKSEIVLKNPKQRYIEEFAKPIPLRLVRSADGLAIEPMAVGGQADAFFGDVRATEHAVSVRSVTDLIRQYYAAGGTAKASARSLVQVLRKELNIKAPDDVLWSACRHYTASLGMPVDLEEPA